MFQPAGLVIHSAAARADGDRLAEPHLVVAVPALRPGGALIGEADVGGRIGQGSLPQNRLFRRNKSIKNEYTTESPSDE